MNIVNRLGCYANEIKEGKINRQVLFVELQLKYDDERFFNIPAPCVASENIDTYRDECGVYVLLNHSDRRVAEICENIIYYSDIDGKPIVIGTLTDDEKLEILDDMINKEEVEDLIEACKDQFVGDFNKEEFKETYGSYFKTID